MIKQNSDIKSILAHEKLPDEKITKDVSLPDKPNASNRCIDCRVENAFHTFRSQHLIPSLNTHISLPGSNAPDGKRSVIEFVTAEIVVPAGEWARLRMHTSLGMYSSNFDLVLTRQGQVDGKQFLVGTHSLKAYSDTSVIFQVNRDNATTEGYVIVNVSGYFVDV